MALSYKNNMTMATSISLQLLSYLVLAKNVETIMVDTTSSDSKKFTKLRKTSRRIDSKLSLSV